MTTHTYPLDNIIGDYFRAGTGLVFVLVPALLTELGGIALTVLLSLAAIFFVYGARTLNRQLTRVSLDETGIRSSGGLSRQLRWAEVEKIDLRYFSTRRDRRNGWLQIRLDGANTVVRIDSQVSEFQQLVEYICQAVPKSQISLGQTTMTNLKSLGIDADNWPAAEAPGAKGEA